MNYIVLEHLSGSKARQVEEFPLSQYTEVIVGRDVSANVRFAEADAVVGRQHLKIVQNPADPTQFFVTDLNSRNGTFVNRQRVIGTAMLRPGDIVQCGPSGPEFRFQLEPKTEPLESGSAPTRPISIPAPVRPAAPAPAQAQARAPVSEVPIMPRAQPQATKANKPLFIGGGILLGLAVLAAGIFGYRSLMVTDANGTTKGAGTPQPTPAGLVSALNSPNVSAGEAERDAERTAWRIEVTPYMALGSGHPGKAASDFDKPDGLSFSPKGLLFATDAKNHRVQVWDVKTGAHLGEFGHGVFGGEIVDIAVAPNETVYITDQSLNLAYTFVPPQPGELDDKGKPLGPYDYQFKGTRFGEQQFKKLGGIAIDSRGRIYVVDAHRNDVRRFNPDNTHDKTFKFEQKRADGDTYLHGCEGVAIDEANGNLFIASEKDAVVQVFDWETGAFKRRMLGASVDEAGKPSGKHVFFGSVEGLAFARGHLLAVDEGAGHIQLFDLSRPDAFNNDLGGYGAPQPNRPSGYQGFFGHGPIVDFEDKTNVELQKRVKLGSIIPGQANAPGYFCSPDSISSYSDPASGETYIAIADQCNYRLVVYRWSDIGKALGQPITIAEVRPTIQPEATATPAAKQVTAPAAHTHTPVKHAAAPVRTVVRKPAVVTPPAVKKPVPAKVDDSATEKKKKKNKKNKQP